MIREVPVKPVIVPPVPGRIVPSRFVLVASLALLWGGMVHQAISASPLLEEGIARDLVAEARIRLEQDDAETAGFLLRRAYGIAPHQGDSLFLLAGILPRDRSHAVVRERLLRRAGNLSLDETDPALVVGDLAHLLIETGRPARARELLEEFHRQDRNGGALEAALALARAADSGIPRLPGSEDQGVEHSGLEEMTRLDYLFLQALLETEPFGASSALIQRFRSRYPRDRALAALDFRRSHRVGLGPLEWFEAALAEPPGSSREASLLAGAIASFLPRVPWDLQGEAGHLRYDLARWYYHLGGKDPLFAVPFLALPGGGRAENHTLSGQTIALVEEALQQGDKRLWEALSRTIRENTPEERFWDEGPFPLGEVFDTAWQNLSRERSARLILQDKPRLTVEEYHFEEGRLVAWKRDRKGDGLFEEVLLFPGGHQGRAILFSRAGSRDQEVLAVHYSRYPLVSRVVRYDLVQGEEGQGALWRESPPAEEIRSRSSFLWIPAGPVPYDIELRLEEKEGFVRALPARREEEPLSLWNGLVGRVRFSLGSDRFLRQLASDDARSLTAAQAREATAELRELGVIR
ncbi:hypothetical protein AU468_00435 [Alkalispirochaeta sphaeroplastigenens]|uniref:Tetratricopeptide repeat protein n=1 Tax=Alkalispirochaeta sphaeroplastigenens TaxID=1187066 RepID=A0A2S4K1N6_9SPIO|nr:hypothetical protein AU468_00435 [Alkalispirochaeta sphaeroplastigenens]